MLLVTLHSERSSPSDLVARYECPECGAEPEDVHATWCLAEEDRYDKILGSMPAPSYAAEEDPLND